ncbi:BC85_0335 family putative methyltransferase [Mycoplasmopsis synoviae]|uniref:BC85_0335 family putative methyltransferase n=1 Tax=Mycoplasmopsis synoviae TaxID=2109 RepID=UPI000382EED3|nr:hypothetical protein [Mycoplasmopsis synoviae]AKB11116.1 hypothetical protein VY93_02050 [Mycoplasmopsis synoviae ATCC 25204]
MIFSENVRKWLSISIGIAFFIALLSIIITWIIIRRTRNRYFAKTQQEAWNQINKLREDVGQLDFSLIELFKTKANAFDIEGILNTIYQNNFENSLIISYKDHFPFYSINNKNKKNTLYLETEFDSYSWDYIKEKVPNKFEKDIKKYDEKSPLNMLAIFSSKNNPIEIFNKLKDKFTNDSLVIIKHSILTKREVKELIAYAKDHKFLYEISPFGTKYFFMVIKK